MNLTSQNRVALVLQHKVPTWIGNRMRIDFWLYVNKARDLEAFEIIEWFKSKGLFRSSAISGLRVLWAYYNNKPDMIIEELPNLREMLQITPPPAPDGGGQLDEIKGLLEVIAAQQKANNGYTMASQPPLPGLQPMTPTTGKQIASPTFALPVFEDDDDEIPTLKLATSTRNDASKNFLNGLRGLH